MEFEWTEAKPLFAKLDFPDYGSNERWMCWYEEAWSHMSGAGITQVQTPLDDTRVRLRILALCWLAHDFCAAAFSEPECSCPSWNEWIDVAEIDPWAVLTATDKKVLKKVVAKSRLMSSDNIDEEGLDLDTQTLHDDVALRLVMAAVRAQRGTVAAALLHGLGGSSLLFASMYGNCGWIEDEIDRRRESLEEELEDLEEQLEERVDDLEEQFGEVLSDESVNKLRKKIEAVRQQLDDGALNQSIVEEIRTRTLTDDIFFGDADSAERMNGFQWCDEGCPVEIRGEPEL